MKITEKAMIVRLSISQWTARKFDRRVSQDVVLKYQADDDAGRWNKQVVDKDSIQQISSVATNARLYFYKNTLPWDDFGGRLLPAEKFLEFSEKMREFRSEFERAYTDFIEQRYDQVREDAKRRLGKMYDPNDYPDKYRLYSKYNFDVVIESVPDGNDFRVSLDRESLESIKKEITERVNSLVDNAVKDILVRFKESLEKVVEKLKDSDAIFRDSLIENVRELVNLAPSLNITKNKEIDAICQEIKSKILVEPDVLRKNKSVRSKVAKDADAILKKMSGYLG